MEVGHSFDKPSSLYVEHRSRAVGRSVVRAGVRTLILMNTHGGNIPLAQPAALRLKRALSILVVRTTTSDSAARRDLFALEGASRERDQLNNGTAPEDCLRNAISAFDSVVALAKNWCALSP
jgi:hypothetical protein